MPGFPVSQVGHTLEIKMAFEAGKAGLPFGGGSDPALQHAYTQGLAVHEQLKIQERAQREQERRKYSEWERETSKPVVQ